VLFEIVDTREMWGQLDIPEGELSRVEVGQAVTLVIEGSTLGAATSDNFRLSSIRADFSDMA
jgi:hypothetical protein